MATKLYNKTIDKLVLMNGSCKPINLVKEKYGQIN